MQGEFCGSADIGGDQPASQHAGPSQLFQIHRETNSAIPKNELYLLVQKGFAAYISDNGRTMDERMDLEWFFLVINHIT